MLTTDSLIEKVLVRDDIGVNESSLGRGRPPISIRTKLTLLIGGLILAVITVMGLIATFEEEKVLMAGHNSRGRTIAEMVAERVKPGLITHDLRELNKIFLDILQFENVDYLLLLDPEGKIIMHNDLTKVGEFYPEKVDQAVIVNSGFLISGDTGSPAGRSIQQMIMPVLVGGIHLGTVHVGYSFAEVKEEISRARRQNLIIGIVATLCGLVIANVLAMLLIRPLKKLTDATRKVSQGELDTVVVEKSNDELGELARSFNAMTRNLQRIMVSRDYFNNVFNSTAEALVVIDTDCSIAMANRAMAKLLGESENSLRGRKCYETLPCRMCHTDNCFLKRILAGSTMVEVETEATTAGRRRLNLQIVATPLIEGGRITGIIQSIQDITGRVEADRERQELHKQLMQAQKMESIGRLAGGVAHDFNNILMVIMSYSELAMLPLAQGDPLADTFREIHRAAKRAAALTSQLLALGRKQMLQKEILNINEVIDQMMKMLRRVIGEDIQLHVEVERPVNPIKADRSQIEQVLMNLAVNARDAMPHGGIFRLRVSTAELRPDQLAESTDLITNPYVLLQVEDTGCGISTELQEQIFEPFFTTKGHEKGTGLGLSTVYGIVKQHAGHIFVDSEIGKGTCFRIYFPFVKEACAEQVQAVEAPVRKGRETILVVDDEPGIRNTLHSCLEKHGYAVITADSGERGLEIATRNKGKIDLVITDIMMHEMSGWKLAEALRGSGLVNRIIFLSGYDSNPEEASKFRTGEERFLNKPLSPDRILAEVRSLIDGTSWKESDSSLQPADHLSG